MPAPSSSARRRAPQRPRHSSGRGPRPTDTSKAPSSPEAPRTPRHTAPVALSPEELAALADAPFAQLGVPRSLVAVLHGLEIREPFPIQAATLPDSIAGRDVIGRGRTGSGKTIAFALPMVATLDEAKARRIPGRPRALVLVPTRELARQVADTVRPLAAAMGQKVAVVHGGVSMGPQAAAIRQGVDIVVACPGRLEDLVQQGRCSLDQVRITVLDEADHMADLGFLPGVKRLLDRTPADAQRLLFSATIDEAVGVLVTRYLHDPVTHSVDEVDEPAPDMTHHVLTVEAAAKAAVVQRLAAGQGRTVLFTRTKHGAKKLAMQLNKNGIRSVELHGNLGQNARERNLADFASGRSPVLVATDIAARGIHVDDVALVVHVDPPVEHKAYVHRSGRTARAGAAGVVVTVATHDQRRDVEQLTRKAGVSPFLHDVHPLHDVVDRLSRGEAVDASTATSVLTAPARTRQASAPRQGGAPRQGAPRQGGAPRGSGHPTPRQDGTAARPQGNRNRSRQRRRSA